MINNYYNPHVHCRSWVTENSDLAGTESTSYHRPKSLKISISLETCNISKFLSLRDDLRCANLGKWCMLPELNDMIQVCKFNSRAMMTIEVDINKELKWSVTVPPLGEISLPSSLEPLPPTIERKEALSRIDTYHYCTGNDLSKYSQVIEMKAHGGIFTNAEGIVSINNV